MKIEYLSCYKQFMKAFLLLTLLFIGCDDDTTHAITCYSNGTVVYKGTSQGTPSYHSGQWSFFDRDQHNKLIRISGTCIVN